MSLLPDELYTDVLQIGANGFERVFFAQKKGVDTPLAVKHIPIENFPSESALHLLYIYQVALHLDHPNLVRHLSARHDLAGRCLIIDMELCEGGSLASLLYDVRGLNRILSESFIWSMVGQVASALAYLHLPFKPMAMEADTQSYGYSSRSIVYAHLSPRSILLTDRSVYARAKLAGLTRMVILDDNQTATALDTLQAMISSEDTDVYIAPEVRADGSDHVLTTKVDIWALGCLIYEMCLRKKPSFDVIKQERPAFSSIDLVDYGYSPTLNKLMYACLEIDPAQRITASEIVLIPEVSQAIFNYEEAIKLHLSNISTSLTSTATDTDIFKSFIKDPDSKILDDAIVSGKDHLVTDICQHILKCTTKEKTSIKCSPRDGIVTSKDTLLMRAAEQGNVADVQTHSHDIGKIYDGPIQLTYKNGSTSLKHGMTALMIAAHYNYVKCTELLLRELGIHGVGGATALMFAAKSGSTDCVKLLLAEATYQDEQGRTALFCAASTDSTEVVELLVQKEARMSNTEGATALMIAAQNGHIKSTRILSLWEAEMQASKGQTALMLAALNGHAECVMILEKLEAGIRSKLGRFALYNAASNNHVRCVEILMEKEACLQDNNGVSSLIIASQKGHRQCVELLLPKEARLCNIMGGTALMAAASRDNIDCVELLISKEARMQTKTGITALYTAAFHDSPASVMLLLDYEAKMVDESGTTALMAAAKKGSIDCISILTPIEKMLRDNKENTALMLAAANNKPDSVRALILAEGGAKKSDGTTALMIAAERGYLQCVLLLIPVEAGLQREDGVTALMLAATNGHSECVRHLKVFEKSLRALNGSDVSEYVEKNRSPRVSRRSFSACMSLLSKK